MITYPMQKSDVAGHRQVKIEVGHKEKERDRDRDKEKEKYSF